MNIQRWKGIVWLASLVVGGGLVYSVYDFLAHKAVLEAEVSDETLSAVLDAVKKPPVEKSDVVEYTSVVKVFQELDWTGKAKPKPEAAQGPGPKPTTPKVAVANLLKVLAIKVDTGRPEKSLAYVKFTDPKLAVHTAKDDPILKPGERLFAPYQDVLVEAITAEGVVFAFDDTAREKETVPTLASDRAGLSVVMVGPEGVILPQTTSRLEDAAADTPPWRPEQLTQIRKNEWQVGTETIQELDRDYTRILSRDISASTHKNPRTGAADGIKINRVAPNSIPAQAGLSEGEVLKSINGHRVTSVNDAIAYVKANANTTDTWTAVFEKQGREFTRTYRSPPR
jgi:hypothetical protein